MNDAYNELMTANKISLFGGFDSKFHNTIRTIKWREHNVKIKCSSCGVNIIGRHGVFDRIGLPHRIDYDGKPRGFPSPIPGQKKGRGSNFDTYLFGMAHNSQTGEWPKGAGGVNSLSRQDKYYMCFDFIKHTANTKKESSWGNKY